MAENDSRDSMGMLMKPNKARSSCVHDGPLPQAFYLEREHGPELNVRLLVRRWQPQPAVE